MNKAAHLRFYHKKIAPAKTVVYVPSDTIADFTTLSNLKIRLVSIQMALLALQESPVPSGIPLVFMNINAAKYSAYSFGQLLALVERVVLA